MRRFHFLVIVVAGCSPDVPPEPSPDAAVEPVPGCPLTANTTPTSTVTGGCALLERDTSSCEAARRAAGIDGLWLQFSCRVEITKTATGIQLVSDGQPDHASNYFPADDECHDDFQPAGMNPNSIGENHMTMTIPLVPDAAERGMGMGTIGLAINGVSLFNNMAANGDDIYAESKTFDRCQGHPTGRSYYHYHSEPYSITSDDSNLIGVLMDGYPIYGRRDVDGTMPVQLDNAGGHTSATPDSATPTYHFHVNLQTSTTPGTEGDQVWFMTKGWYHGTPGTCAGCM